MCRLARSLFSGCDAKKACSWSAMRCGVSSPWVNSSSARYSRDMCIPRAPWLPARKLIPALTLAINGFPANSSGNAIPCIPTQSSPTSLIAPCQACASGSGWRGGSATLFIHPLAVISTLPGNGNMILLCYNISIVTFLSGVPNCSIK
ncbi:hypothetical protein D3C72_1618050 [compost metagenome]